MQFASIGSGSKGNGTLLRTANQVVLVDCGFTLKETCARLERLGVSPQSLDGVLVTHEHGDHIRGVASLAVKFDLTVYATFGTCKAASERLGLSRCRIEEVRPGREFAIGDIQVMPVAVPHDAREPCQYTLSHAGRKMGVLTDLGSITGHVVDCFTDCDAMVLEANHDWQMLSDGPYPYSLKKRVGGDRGHLSNDQTCQFLQQVQHQRFQHLVLSHLSEQNNTPAHVQQAVTQVIESQQDRIQVASQADGFDWLAIN